MLTYADLIRSSQAPNAVGETLKRMLENPSLEEAPACASVHAEEKRRGGGRRLKRMLADPSLEELEEARACASAHAEEKQWGKKKAEAHARGSVAGRGNKAGVLVPVARACRLRRL